MDDCLRQLQQMLRLGLAGRPRLAGKREAIWSQIAHVRLAMVPIS